MRRKNPTRYYIGYSLYLISGTLLLAGAALSAALIAARNTTDLWYFVAMSVVLSISSGIGGNKVLDR